ncbi:2-hydroxychromene-2-carboxylate isomerase [Candidimonas nitroreducens]|uniref:2-hydroxychromene-2-carboxylate isomerase n=1 Tax=Candidimonas nitroreducens TaxID=683354 RepID=A0A225MAW8_9BURK|nr:2-hydroxychromene-2-carboxylate isomerase [Candidimonas nitroreducens]OWT57433.1 2-hydroxychromene-2-carboxylate isomerase [Candidimonas nitroreducens]
MNSPIDFYFDFSSPYSYCASTRVDALGAELGRAVRWHPILLGPVFKQIGVVPLVDVPIKGRYALHDFARTAALFDIPYVHPQKFPVATIGAARAMLWIDAQHGAAKARDFAHAVFHAYFAAGQDISQPEVVLAAAQQAGLDAGAVAQGMQQDDIKAALKSGIEAATARGVFGAPFIFIDDEPFWGFDRFDYIRRWLQRRGPGAAA